MLRLRSKWHFNIGTTGEYRVKHTFITMNQAYHGDTIGAVSVGAIPLYHDVFRPMLFPLACHSIS